MILLVFALHAGWPVPDVNEPHYLGKARHYWHPDWADRDFFLASSDTHLVFYATLGMLTRWLSLPAAAWVGRIITWTLLAAAWRQLSRTLVPRFGWAVLSAALLVALNDRLHMAGEWIVGGVEGKGIAYALVFAGLSLWTADRPNLALATLGAAASFHVLVGGWSVVALLIGWRLLGPGRPPLASLVPGLLAGGLLALPGAWPALAMNSPTDPQLLAEANEIYVYRRLRHHLTPAGFQPHFIVRHLLLLVAFFLLGRLAANDDRLARLRSAVWGAVAISVAGWCVAALAWLDPHLAAGLLRFYWFRLGDSFLPLGVALSAITIAAAAGSRNSGFRPPQRWVVLASLFIAAWHLLACGVHRVRPDLPRGDRPPKVENYADWRDACRWIADSTPPDALFLTPRLQQTFKWHTNRAEVVTWKDIPQDARSIVLWWQRIEAIHATGSLDPDQRWYESLATMETQRVASLAHRFGADYVLTAAQPPLALPRRYQNNSYAVYEVPPPSPAAGP